MDTWLVLETQLVLEALQWCTTTSLNVFNLQH